MRTVPSSVIESIDYDAAAARLFVTFNGGRIYGYDDVPAAAYEAFAAAESKGTFFNAEIKDRYRTWRLVWPRRLSRP
jgi:hypothetical protein